MSRLKGATPDAYLAGNRGGGGITGRRAGARPQDAARSCARSMRRCAAVSTGPCGSGASVAGRGTPDADRRNGQRLDGCGSALASQERQLHHVVGSRRNHDRSEHGAGPHRRVELAASAAAAARTGRCHRYREYEIFPRKTSGAVESRRARTPRPWKAPTTATAQQTVKSTSGPRKTEPTGSFARPDSSKATAAIVAGTITRLARPYRPRRPHDQQRGGTADENPETTCVGPVPHTAAIPVLSRQPPRLPDRERDRAAHDGQRKANASAAREKEDGRPQQIELLLLRQRPQWPQRRRNRLEVEADTEQIRRV